MPVYLFLFLILLIAATSTTAVNVNQSKTNQSAEGEIDSNHNDIHQFMLPSELRFYFDESLPELVDASTYHLVSIGRSEVSAVEKRNGATHHSTISMEAFGKAYHLKLSKNQDLLYRGAKIVLEDDEQLHVDPERHGQCHFSIQDESILGGISDCGGHYHGFLKDEEEIFDIVPLAGRLHKYLPEGSDKVHIVRKSATYIEQLKQQVKKRDAAAVIDDELLIPNDAAIHMTRPSRQKRADKPPIIIETGLFFDCKAFKMYNDYYHDTDKLVDFLMSLLNGMQSVYHYPTLGRKVSFCVVYVQMQKKCLVDDAGGEREQMLMNFCEFQKKIKAKEDMTWDLGLLMSGRDMWGSASGGRKSYSTMGLSTVTGVCEEDYGCVIGEIGVRDPQGKPYPSAGYLRLECHLLIGTIAS